MEARNFGFGLNAPPAFKFDPTEADIVAHYLLPRALGLHNPYAHAIIEGVDPGSVPPWEIIRRRGDHAFFFVPPGGRKTRTVQGAGVWMGQKGYENTVTLLRPGGGEVDIGYRCYHLSFGLTKDGPSTGHIMHEYTILSPPLPGTVLTRIKFRKKAKNADPDPVPEQPAGPSYEYSAATHAEGFAEAQDGALCDSNGGGGYSYNPLEYALPVCEYDGNHGVPIPDQSGASYNYNEGYTDAQTDAFYGGGMVMTDGTYCDPSNYLPECRSEYGNYYGEYEPLQYQQDPCNQYQAGDTAVMCSGDEAFMGEEEAGGNSDKGSVMGTNKTSAHSTISLCDENTLFGIGDGHDLKCEQNDAGDPIN